MRLTIMIPEPAIFKSSFEGTTAIERIASPPGYEVGFDLDSAQVEWEDQADFVLEKPCHYPNPVHLFPALGSRTAGFARQRAAWPKISHYSPDPGSPCFGWTAG